MCCLSRASGFLEGVERVFFWFWALVLDVVFGVCL